MCTTCSTQDPRSELPDEIAERIRRYRPKSLDNSQWAVLEEDVKASVARTAPVSREDAQTTLVSVCAFLATMLVGEVPSSLGDVLTEQLIAAYPARALAEGKASGTVQTDIGRVKRLHRVQQGLPAKIPRRPRRSEGGPPYSDTDVDAYVGLGANLGDPAGAAVVTSVVMGVGAGVAVPQAYRAELSATDDGPFVTLDDDGDRYEVTGGAWLQNSVRVAAHLTRDDWRAARRAVADAGLPALTARRLRNTWLCTLLSSTTDPVLDLIGTFRFTRRDLDGVVAHLPVMDNGEFARLLREV